MTVLLYVSIPAEVNIFMLSELTIPIISDSLIFIAKILPPDTVRTMKPTMTGNIQMHALFMTAIFQLMK